VGACFDKDIITLNAPPGGRTVLDDSTRNGTVSVRTLRGLLLQWGRDPLGSVPSSASSSTGGREVMAAPNSLGHDASTGSTGSPRGRSANACPESTW
jgi:hypothetical protein